MKVLLLQQVRKLGSAGMIKEVSRGYAINHLIPLKLAKVVGANAIESLQKRSERDNKIKARGHRARELLKRKLNGRAFTIKAKANDKGTLFAAIGAKEVWAELRSTGYEVGKAALDNGLHIKQIGEHTVLLDFGEAGMARIKLIINSQK